MLTASLFTHVKEKASEASAKHAGKGVGFVSEVVPTPYPYLLL